MLIIFGLIVGDVSFAKLERTDGYVTDGERGVTPSEISCDVLYVTNKNLEWTSSSREERNKIYSLNPTLASGGQLYTTRAYQVANAKTGTIAVGPYGGPGGKMTMYFWGHAYGGSNMPNLTPEANARLTAFHTGVSNLYEVKPGMAIQAANGTGWSGGEVDQRTGILYITSDSSSRVGTAENYWSIQKFDPSGETRGVLAMNRKAIPPETPEDRVDQDFNISADLAIDANGNAYVLAIGAGSWHRKLILRFNVGTSNDPDTWTYNKVFEFEDKISVPSQAIFGMAFLNGKLYAGQGDGTLYAMNLLEQTFEKVGQVNGKVYDPDWGRDRTVPIQILDLASCQTAPVIEGKIYQDATGTGAGPGDLSVSGVGGVDLEIWKEQGGRPVYKSTVSSGGAGSFRLY